MTMDSFPFIPYLTKFVLFEIFKRIFAEMKSMHYARIAMLITA